MGLFKVAKPMMKYDNNSLSLKLRRYSVEAGGVEVLDGGVAGETGDLVASEDVPKVTFSLLGDSWNNLVAGLVASNPMDLIEAIREERKTKDIPILFSSNIYNLKTLSGFYTQAGLICFDHDCSHFSKH